MAAVELGTGLYHVGSRDWNRRQFDALISIPHGTTYNSYIIKGKEKTAMVDTVAPEFEKEFGEKVERIIGIEAIDYLVMNHAEPDHAGAIPYIIGRNKKARLLTTKKGAKMAATFYHVPEERIDVVTEDTTIDLGGRTLRFIDAPFLHWPETMFTYLVEDRVLFPCDFFGAHTAFGLYDDDVEDTIYHAKKYFGEIMMPFRPMAKRALAKVKELGVEMIAPGHGPVYRNCSRILEAYTRWCEGKTKNKATIVYVTMWHSTERMVNAFVDTLQQGGVEVALYNLADSDVGDVAADLVDSAAIVIGTPVVLGGMHPLAMYAAYLVKALRPPVKHCAILSSYGWGGGAIKQATEMLAPLKLNVVGTVEINGPPTKEDMEEVEATAKALAENIKEGLQQV